MGVRVLLGGLVAAACAVGLAGCGTSESQRVGLAWHHFATEVNADLFPAPSPAPAPPPSKSTLKPVFHFDPSKLPTLPPGLQAEVSKPSFAASLLGPAPGSQAAAGDVSARGCAALVRAEMAADCGTALLARLLDSSLALPLTLTAVHVNGTTATAQAGALTVHFVRQDHRWLIAAVPAG
jgi:hypothetical protein